MELLEQIKRDQIRKKARKPHRRPVLAVVCAVVNRYGLSDDFVRKLDTDPDILPGNVIIAKRIREKDPLDAAPFPLVEPGPLRVAGLIAEAARNPYLAFAHSPEEIALSRQLYSMNPDISPELLENRHFETLVLAEFAKIRISEMSAPENFHAAENHPRAPGKPAQRPRKNEAPPAAREDLRKRIRELRGFIAFVENPNGSGD